VDLTQIYILALVGVLILGSFAYNRNLAERAIVQDRTALGPRYRGLSPWHSQANYHGYFTACAVALVIMLIFIAGLALGGDGQDSKLALVRQEEMVSSEASCVESAQQQVLDAESHCCTLRKVLRFGHLS